MGYNRMRWRGSAAIWVFSVCGIAGILLIEAPRYAGSHTLYRTVMEMLHRAQMEQYPSPYKPIVFGLTGTILLVAAAWILLKCARTGGMSLGGRPYLLSIVGVMIAAAALRTINYLHLPYGLWIDNAMAGLHALTVLKYREFPLYFHTNYGYEPIMPYLMTAAISFLGNTAVAIRLPGLIAGLVTLLVHARFSRVHFDRLTSLVSTAFLGFSLCHIVLSRQGFRCILMPLFALLTVHCLLKAFSGAGSRWFIYSGIWLGLSNYTYVAIRFFVFVVFVVILHQWWVHRLSFRRIIGIMARVYIPAGCIVAPLMVYFHRNPHLFSGRAVSTVIFNQPGAWPGLLHNTRQLLGMFLLAGDIQPRHNILALPALNPIEGLFFIAGLLWITRNLKKPQYWALFSWMGVMMVPSWITEGAPSFMRLLSIFPAMALIGAVGFREVIERLPAGPRGKYAVLVLVILSGLAYSAVHTFVTWPHVLDHVPADRRSHYGFCEDEYDLAQMCITDDQNEFVLSPQLFFHPTIQYLCYGKTGLILASDPNDILPYFDNKEGVVFVFTNVKRNLWWIRDSREKDFFAWQKREYGISSLDIYYVLLNYFGTRLPVMESDHRLETALRAQLPEAPEESVGIITVIRYPKFNKPE
jgi:4-amino-4-deoxy-L-arabinose transferase-like glycosyltransferase